MAKGINIRFPFKETQSGGVFDTNKTTDNAIKDDLIALLTLRKGQRPMRSTMFSPIYDFIMEQLDSHTKKQLQLQIEEKVSEFIPQITITKINFTENIEENLLTIEIVFKIDTSFGIEDSIILNIPREHDSVGESGETITDR